MNRRAGVITRRNPQRTRERLLQAAFQEIYKSGFRGTDLETILRAAGVTKGAMYHHFASKEALGYAVVDEIIASITREKWLWPLQNAKNPIDALIGIIQSTSLRPADLRCGCPLNNLAQEMSRPRRGFPKEDSNDIWGLAERNRHGITERKATQDGAQRRRPRRSGCVSARNVRRLYLSGEELPGRRASAGWRTNNDSLPGVAARASEPNERSAFELRQFVFTGF